MGAPQLFHYQMMFDSVLRSLQSLGAPCHAALDAPLASARLAPGLAADCPQAFWWVADQEFKSVATIVKKPSCVAHIPSMVAEVEFRNSNPACCCSVLSASGLMACVFYGGCLFERPKSSFPGGGFLDVQLCSGLEAEGLSC